MNQVSGLYLSIPPRKLQRNYGSIVISRTVTKEVPLEIAEDDIAPAKVLKIPFAILNNNLSLAKMEHPMWGDCVSSNDKDYLNFLSKINECFSISP